MIIHQGNIIHICNSIFNYVDEVCFKPLNYDYVVEGKRAQLGLTLSRPLPTSLTVQLEYFDITAKKSKPFNIIWPLLFYWYIAT